MKLRSLFAILLCIYAAAVGERGYAQKPISAVIDSLKQILKGAKADTQRVNILCELSYNYHSQNTDTGVIYGKEALALASSLKWEKGVARSSGLIGTNYMIQANYPEALGYFFNSLKLYEELNDKRGIAKQYERIGIVFQYQGKYTKSIGYHNKGLQIDEEINNKLGTADILSDIGIDYTLMASFDTARDYILKSRKLYSELGLSKEVARSYANIGMVYADARNNKKALESYFTALKGFAHLNDKNNISICYVNIGEIYENCATDTVDRPSAEEKRVFLHKATLYVDSAIVIEKEVDNLNPLLASYKDEYEIAELLGDYHRAFDKLKQYNNINDSIFSTKDKIRIADIESKYILEIKQKQIEINKLDVAKKKNERWFFISAIALLTIIGILFINKQSLKQKRLEAEMKGAEAELGSAVKLLEGFRQSVHEKNTIIEQVTNEMARMKEGELQEIDNEAISRLERTILLTDEQWEEFRALFEKVHKGFFKRVKEKMPDLTPAELRFVALSKLKLTPKEMAAMLGISSNSIRNYRHRLRKKLDLGEDASIEEIADAI